MNTSLLIKSAAIGLAVCLFIALGLESTAWGFYELFFATGIEALYTAYSIFRGIAYALELSGNTLNASIIVGFIFMLISMAIIKWRSRA